MKNVELSEFNKVSAQEWRDKIISDLKGKPIESIIKETTDGIAIKPDYSADDLPPLNHLQFVNSAVTAAQRPEGWFVNQDFDCSDSKKANSAILNALNNGVDSIGLHKISSSQLPKILTNVLPQYIQVRFKDAAKLVYAYESWATEQNLDTHQFTGTFEVYYFDLSLEERKKLAQFVSVHFPKMTLVDINGGYFFNQGATNAQQMAIALSMGGTILEEFIEFGISPEKAAKLIGFSLAIGTQYFEEIAKFRAFYALWAVILNEFNITQHPTSLHGYTSLWSQAIPDMYNNMLRGTTQTLSAIVGGCNTITVTPFDTLLNEPSEFSNRMARNIQLILRDESFTNQVADMASGSYFIENLTSGVAQKAWDLFLEIEHQGGYLKANETGWISAQVAQSKEAAWQKVKAGQTPILGVNKYPNPQEDVQELLQSQKNNSPLFTLAEGWL